MKEKIVLKKEMETLLIPLYGRAKMSLRGIIEDAYACETVAAIDYDFEKLRIPKKLEIFMAIRSGIIDDYTKQFLFDNPQATVISLGSGLDARYAKMSGYKKWIDLDYPEVSELRKKLLPEAENHLEIASSVTDWAWLEKAEGSGGKTLIIAEGLLMYLTENEVRDLFGLLTSKFQDATSIFDAYSLATVNNIKRQSSFKKTGAAIHWGFDEPGRVTELNPKMLHEKTIYLTEKKYTDRLDPFYRFMFAFAGRFSAAREAHRVLVFRSK